MANGWYSALHISLLIKPIGIVLCIVFIVDLSPLQRGIACKDRAFMEGAALVNVRVVPQKRLPKWQVDGIQPCFLLLSGLGDCSFSYSKKGKKNTSFFKHFLFVLLSLTGKSVSCRRAIHNHNSLAPPHADHQPSHILLWARALTSGKMLLKLIKCKNGQ